MLRNEESLGKKKKKEASESTPNPPLPDDLLLSCLARVSRLYYPTLSLVSKKFRSFVASPELYKTRSLSGRTESCLYVYIRFPDIRWYALSKRSNGYVLVTVPIPHSPPLVSSSLVAVGSNIYNIGSAKDDEPSSSVSVLDCKSHKWCEAPSLLVGLKVSSICTGILDGKIYVAGACRDGYPFQVLDTKTLTWDQLPSPYSVEKRCSLLQCACIDGKFRLLTHRNGWGKEMVDYNPKEGRWDLVEGYMSPDCYPSSCCVIDNVLYSGLYGFRWYDTKLGRWEILKGLVRLPIIPHWTTCVRLADYDGKMAVFMEKCLRSDQCSENVIQCVVIALEKRGCHEIWGEIEWSSDVLTVPADCYLGKALAVTV